MATFHYKGFDAAGKPVRGLLESASAKSAREHLLSRGILVEKISITSRGARFPIRARATVYRELASLVEAGVPLVPAMVILIDTPELVGARLCIARIRDALKDGGGLSDAFQAGGAVTAFEIAMLQTAQQSASIGPVLERLADFLEQREDMRERVRSALIYPVIVAVMGVCVAMVMLGVLLPRMQAFVEDSQVELPAITQFMLSAGRWGKVWGPLAACCFVGAIVAWRLRLKKDQSLREKWDRSLLSLPGIGRGYEILVNMRFTRTLCLLLQGGVPLIDAFVLSGRATGSIWVTGLVEKEADRVRHGDRLSEAVARIPPLAGGLPGWVRVGEASGGIAHLMETAAKRYEAQWERFMSRSMSVLEPALIIVIGGFVLLVTLAVLLPVLDMTRAVQP